MNPGRSEGELCGDTFPECDGDCPPGLTCMEDPAGGPDCFCDVPDPEPCGDTFPECDGECPPGLTCFEDPSGCSCTPQVPTTTPWGQVALFLTLLMVVALLASRLPYFRKA